MRGPAHGTRETACPEVSARPPGPRPSPTCVPPARRPPPRRPSAGPPSAAPRRLGRASPRRSPAASDRSPVAARGICAKRRKRRPSFSTCAVEKSAPRRKNNLRVVMDRSMEPPPSRPQLPAGGALAQKHPGPTPAGGAPASEPPARSTSNRRQADPAPSASEVGQASAAANPAFIHRQSASVGRQVRRAGHLEGGLDAAGCQPPPAGHEGNRGKREHDRDGAARKTGKEQR